MKLPRLLTSALVVAACTLVACSQSSDPSAGSSVALTTTVASTSTTVPATTVSPTTTAAPTTSTTIEPTTTTAPPPLGWVAVDSFPSLAYPPCCGSNWSGIASPAIPADAATPLAPGLYFASRLDNDTATDSITFEVSRFESCSKLPADACESSPFAADDMGVVEPAARGYTLQMDDTVRVGVSGFKCEPDQQMATGKDLAPLMAAFDKAYEQLLGGPFRTGDSADDLFDALSQTPAGGFSSPECPPEMGTIGSLVWQGDDGPPILLQTQFAYDQSKGVQVAPASASAEWLRLTAIEIAADGSPTLYFYAGFYS